MLGRLATLVGYSKAPKATYVLRHPVKGTAALLAAKHISRNAAIGMGAAAVAVPLGIWFATRSHGHDGQVEPQVHTDPGTMPLH